METKAKTNVNVDANLKIRITQEKWKTLDKDQQTVLTKLGITPKETANERRKQKFYEEAETYVLGVYSDCTLCSHRWSEKWKMVPVYDNEDGAYYQGYLIPNGHLILEDKRDNRSQVTCTHCYRRLSKLPKQVVIKKLVAYAKYAATWGGGGKQ